MGGTYSDTLLKEYFTLSFSNSSCVIRVIRQRRRDAETRRVECFLCVMSSVKHVHEDLDVALRLLWGFTCKYGVEEGGEGRTMNPPITP
jgi:hypothetical protein